MPEGALALCQAGAMPPGELRLPHSHGRVAATFFS
jgi:hypothetical protein